MRKVAETVEESRKIVKQITLPRNILIAILGEKALAYYASSTFSGTVITTALKGVALSAQQFGAAILTASFTPVGVVAVGALAVGGIYWYWNRSKNSSTTKRQDIYYEEAKFCCRRVGTCGSTRRPRLCGLLTPHLDEYRRCSPLKQSLWTNEDAASRT